MIQKEDIVSVLLIFENIDVIEVGSLAIEEFFYKESSEKIKDFDGVVASYLHLAFNENLSTTYRPFGVCDSHKVIDRILKYKDIVRLRVCCKDEKEVELHVKWEDSLDENSQQNAWYDDKGSLHITFGEEK